MFLLNEDHAEPPAIPWTLLSACSQPRVTIMWTYLSFPWAVLSMGCAASSIIKGLTLASGNLGSGQRRPRAAWAPLSSYQGCAADMVLSCQGILGQYDVFSSSSQQWGNYYFLPRTTEIYLCATKSWGLNKLMLFGRRSGCPTDVRLALSLLFPVSFVSPHRSWLLLVTSDPFLAVGHQEPFSWSGVTLTGKEYFS